MKSGDDFNVLITSASRKVWLIKAFKRAIAEEGNGKVIAGDASPRSPTLCLADEGVILPRDDDPNQESWLQEYCIRKGIKLLVPTRDEELPIFAGLSKSFLAEGIRIMVAESEVIETCRDKRKFVEFCQTHGFRTPMTFSVIDEIQNRDFPLFLKERFGKGGKNIFQAKDQADLEYILKRMQDPIVQKFVDATEYTVDVLSNFEGEVISAIPRERSLIIAGESQVSITRMNWKIIHEASNLSTELGLVGHNTIQCFETESDVEFIEVNPRFGGAANLGFAAGCCSPRLLIDMVRGKPVLPRLGQFEPNLMMLRYSQDLFIQEEELVNSFDKNQSRVV
jgi:carbamoyl-phosphate synthase large subunit